MPDVTCAFCGKTIPRRPSQIAANKSGLYFCNPKEKAQYWSLMGKSSEEQKGLHNHSFEWCRKPRRKGAIS